MQTPPLDEPIWVASPAALRDMVSDLSSHTLVAVDTESNGLHAYRERICLMQFTAGEHDYLVDPFALKDLSPLESIFCNPAIEKVFHAAEYDLICLKRDYGFSFCELFDTMLAARILGRPGLGLGSLLEKEFGVVLDKHYQRSNWARRPLPAPQMAYARMDTHYLLPLRERLLGELHKFNLMALAQEDFKRMCAVQGGPEETMEQLVWRIIGPVEVNARQSGALYELCRYRDTVAQRSNVPVFKVMSNESLLAVAQSLPQTPEDLARIRALPPSNARMHGRELLAAVARGVNRPPMTRPNGHGRPDPNLSLRVERLRVWRKQNGEKLGVESNVVLPRDVMEAIAQANPRTLPELEPLMRDVPWRFEKYGKQILIALIS